MLTTTIYDQLNATVTGDYHTYKGERITVEFMGTMGECAVYVDSIREYDDGSNEVQHVIIRDKVKLASPVHTGFALHNAWMSVA